MHFSENPCTVQAQQQASLIPSFTDSPSDQAVQDEEMEEGEVSISVPVNPCKPHSSRYSSGSRRRRAGRWLGPATGQVHRAEASRPAPEDEEHAVGDEARPIPRDPGDAARIRGQNGASVSGVSSCSASVVIVVVGRWCWSETLRERARELRVLVFFAVFNLPSCICISSQVSLCHQSRRRAAVERDVRRRAHESSSIRSFRCQCFTCRRYSRRSIVLISASSYVLVKQPPRVPLCFR